MTTYSGSGTIKTKSAASRHGAGTLVVHARTLMLMVSVLTMSSTPSSSMELENFKPCDTHGDNPNTVIKEKTECLEIAPKTGAKPHNLVYAWEERARAYCAIGQFSLAMRHLNRSINAWNARDSEWKEN